MKKKIATGICLILLFLCVLAGCSTEEANGDYLRIHIRANSDAACDQDVKLAVRDSLIGYLSPFLQEASTRRQAEEIVTSRAGEIERAVNELLYSCGFYYGCTVRVDTEYFDERSYGSLTLPEGAYRAIIVELGSGQGKNWWCVAFPPLCFTLDENVENVQYKSILVEIVKKYVKKERYE